MPNNQKRTLISYILFYGGILYSICIVIFLYVYTSVLDYSMHIGLFIILSLIGIIMIFFAGHYNLQFYCVQGHLDEFTKLFIRGKNRGFIQGIPNNSCKEYVIKDILNLSEIHLEEIDKSIFIGDINGRQITFDMRWWIIKNYYIYEILLTQIYCKIIKKKKLSKQFFAKKIYLSDNKKNIVLFIKCLNGQNKTYKLITNGVLSSNFSYKLFMMQKKYIMTNKIKKYSIYDFYDSLNE